MRRPTRRRRRLGFTLVELLVVMVVLGLLVALLVPAIAGAIKAARAAQVTAEINNLATALAQFKSTYSDYPPSRIILNESGNYSTTDTTLVTSVAPFNSNVQTDITVGQLSQRTVRYMTKFFPRALMFSTTGTGTAVDINGDGSSTGVFYLDGGECLVLFLGGMTATPIVGNPGAPIGMSGFARVPTNPFNRASTSRTQPLYEFKGDRLVDVDGDGFPSYNDALASGAQGRYYAYFSAYGGNSYDPNDCNFYYDASTGKGDKMGQTLGDTFSRVFEVNFSVNVAGFNGSPYPTSPPNFCVSPSPNPYTATPPVANNGTAPIVAPTTWQNPQTFQIISAGSDQLFGVGGQFAGNNATDKLPIASFEQGSSFSSGWTGGVVGGSVVDGLRNTENDNLSNFVSTRLNQ